MHTESAPGQYEWTMKPSYNIKAADNSFLYKNTIKHIARNHNIRAMFATTPQCDNTFANSNGAHFNHSLWDKNGNNLFFDKNSPNKLSLIGRYWIGGILKHLNGLTAFAVSTENCFRRINNKFNWSPCNASYGFDHRLTTIRIKTDDNNQNGCYIEYRLPCSASNPYHIISSIIIAGMDGIKNKILPKYNPHKIKDGPPNLCDKYSKIPQHSTNALNELS